ncbi:uncharacterized protein LOC110982576 [Acanthaster planci]|uniref:Uncharacterized protein LOC110982576 n=1 Tax=Acanthaster planci TaxID=133434 RepID=A0A8B7YVQ8_ACAPL|nr:uncharacterized protein LOC110982576 [Acanthaster planci]
MGCTNSKIGLEPLGPCQQAWVGSRPPCKGWRRVFGRVVLPMCGVSNRVVPIGVNPHPEEPAERTDFNKPTSEPLDIPDDDDVVDIVDPAMASPKYRPESASSWDLPRPNKEGKDVEVIDLEEEAEEMTAVQYFASRSASPLPTRLPIQRAWRERPPSRGGIQMELALYGKNATRPLPSCLSRAVLENNFKDKQLQDDVRRAQRQHLETHLSSVCHHDSKARDTTRKPSAVQSCLDAFMQHEQSRPLTKFGRRLHKVCVSPVEEQAEAEPQDTTSPRASRVSSPEERPESTCRGEYDFYF